MRYCRYCGGEVSDTAKACGHCGRWLCSEPATAPPDVPKERRQVQSASVVSPSVEPVSPEPPSAERGDAQPAAAVEPGEAAPPVKRDVRPEPPAPSAVERPVSAQKPIRSMPPWVWGLAAVVVILVAGAALAASGALGLPGQKTAAPQATVAWSATPQATRESASVPAPVVEPTTILLRMEDVWQTVDADRPVLVEWVWGVCDPSLLEDNLDALEFKVRVDGEVTATGNMAEYRTDLREEEFNGVHAWWQHYSYPMGSFRSGSAHWLDLERGFSREVTDGCDLNGDGDVDRYSPDFVKSSTVHLVVR
jgi:hypothetical protein